MSYCFKYLCNREQFSKSIFADTNATKMNNIQKCILTKKTKTKQQQTNRNKNKTPKYLYIVVIHHYLLYLKKKSLYFPYCGKAP